MSFTSLDQVVSALPGQFRSVMKASISAKAAGTFTDLFLAAGVPSAGAAPGAHSAGGTAYTNGGTVSGALPWVAPGASLKAYLARLSFAGSTAGTLILYDRLWACTGMSGTVTGAQNITSFPALPTRAGTGEGVEPWIEWYSATGGTAANVTATYTNSAGTTGRTTPSIAFQATPTAYQMLPLPLALGDLGVQALASVTLSGTTGTAGAFGVTLLKRIAEIPMTVANVQSYMDVFSLGLPLIEDNTCLCPMMLVSGTSTGVISGNLSLISG